MNVYLQKDVETNLPHHFDVACALYGAKDLGLTYKFVSFEQVESGQFDNLISIHLFVGSVEFMSEVFRRINKFPKKLPNNDREEYSTLGEVRTRISNGESVFVKPSQIKLFTGTVYDNYYISALDEYPDDMEVIIDKPFDSPIDSEWRIYVKDGKMIDSRNYLGNHLVHFDVDKAQSFVDVFKNMARCFTCDVAVLENGETICVEVNDMWAIGNYGMENDRYVELLRTRYFEILKWEPTVYEIGDTIVCVHTKLNTNHVEIKIGKTYLVKSASEVMYHTYDSKYGPEPYQILELDGLSNGFSSLLFQKLDVIRENKLNNILG